MCVIYPVVSIWKGSRFAWPVGGLIWFSLTIIGCCVIIGFLAGSYHSSQEVEQPIAMSSDDRTDAGEIRQ